MSFEVFDPVEQEILLAKQVPIGTTWRHRNGHDYKITGHCTLEATVEPGVLYRRVEGDGPVWARNGQEFLDGRFSCIHWVES